MFGYLLQAGHVAQSQQAHSAQAQTPVLQQSQQAACAPCEVNGVAAKAITAEAIRRNDFMCLRSPCENEGTNSPSHAGSADR